MFKKLVSTILIMALLLQCSALTVFADSEIAELLDVDAAIGVAEVDSSETEDNFEESEIEDDFEKTETEVDFEEEQAPSEEVLEKSEEETEVIPEVKNEVDPEENQDETTAEQPEEKTEEVQTSDEQAVVPEEKAEQQVEEPVEKEDQVAEITETSKEEENVPSTSDVVIETPEIPLDNTQEKFEEALEAVDNTENEDLTEGRREYFSLYESEVPALKEIVKDNYAGADAVNYNAFYGPYNGTIAFEDSTAKTVRTIFNTYENNLDLSKYEAIIGLYLFGEDEEDAPIVKLEVVYVSESNAPLYFENAAGAIVELGTPKLNAQDGLYHSVVLLNKDALDKLNFYSNPGYMADVLKIVGADAVIHAISISADRYCFANAVEMISDVESTYPVAGTAIQFPEGMGYGYSVSYNDGDLSFNCLKDSWMEILFDNENVEIAAEDTFAFTLPEVPAGKVEATLPKDDEKKNGEKDKDEKDEENKLATDTDLAVKDNNDSNESKPATNTDLEAEKTEEIESIPDATPVEVEVTEELPEDVAEVVETVDQPEETLEVVEEESAEEETVEDETSEENQFEEAEEVEFVDEYIEEDQFEETEQLDEFEEVSTEKVEDSVQENDDIEIAGEVKTESEVVEETVDYTVIEDLVEEDSTPIEFDSTVIDFNN